MISSRHMECGVPAGELRRPHLLRVHRRGHRIQVLSDASTALISFNGINVQLVNNIQVDLRPLCVLLRADGAVQLGRDVPPLQEVQEVQEG